MPKNQPFFVWPTPQEWISGIGHLTLLPPLRLVRHGDADWFPAVARQAAEVLNRASGGAGPAVVEGEGSEACLCVTTMESLPPSRRPLLSPRS